MRRGGFGLLPWLSFVAACAATPPPSDPSDGDGDRADPCDMCVLQRSDDSVTDEDGCPAPDLHLTDACTLSPAQDALLSRVATQIAGETHLTRVRLVSGKAACANAVQVALQQHGLASTRIEVTTRGSEPGVSLEVGAWDGKRCDAAPTVVR